MKTLTSYVCDGWIDADRLRAGGARPLGLINPATEEPVAEALSGGWSTPAVLGHARKVGGASLRALSFARRGELLTELSKMIHAHRDELITLTVANGDNTRSDAKFDIDGASSTLMSYAGLGRSLGEGTFLVDGEVSQLTRSVRFCGRHVWVTREGVAVHVNAFNFPAWGMAEKAACALAAGMPILTKPATSTALVAHRIFELFIESGLVPAGAMGLIVGEVGDLLDHLEGQDVLAFTGSSDTGQKLRSGRQVVAASVRVNIEADSLNAAVLGPDVERGSELHQMFVTDVAREMTQKAGQKCTAIRRVFVPEALIEGVREDLLERLGRIKLGNPADEEVTMGPVATGRQHADVQAGIARLREEARLLTPEGPPAPIGVAPGKGYFVVPTLLQADAERADRIHREEVFGPVTTLVAYSGSASDATALVRRGAGSLVSSVYTDDREFARELLLGIAPYNGRVFIGSTKIAGQAMSPGTVLPQLVHGGPGRAGGGEELGGLRGLHFYMQRTAVSGDKPLLEALLG